MKMYRSMKQKLLDALRSKRYKRTRGRLYEPHTWRADGDAIVCRMCVQGVMAHIVGIAAPSEDGTACMRDLTGTMHVGNFSGRTAALLATTYGVEREDLIQLMMLNDRAAVGLDWEPLLNIIQNADELPDPETPIATPVTA